VSYDDDPDDRPIEITSVVVAVGEDRPTDL
jgi:hypothetical protein